MKKLMKVLLSMMIMVIALSFPVMADEDRTGAFEDWKGREQIYEYDGETGMYTYFDDDGNQFPANEWIGWGDEYNGYTWMLTSDTGVYQCTWVEEGGTWYCFDEYGTSLSNGVYKFNQAQYTNMPILHKSGNTMTDGGTFAADPESWYEFNGYNQYVRAYTPAEWAAYEAELAQRSAQFAAEEAARQAEANAAAEAERAAKEAAKAEANSSRNNGTPVDKNGNTIGIGDTVVKYGFLDSIEGSVLQVDGTNIFVVWMSIRNMMGWEVQTKDDAKSAQMRGATLGDMSWYNMANDNSITKK